MYLYLKKLILICSIFSLSTNIYCKELPLDGDWIDSGRSNYPIKAYLNNNIIEIKSNDKIMNITIRISNNNNLIYENTHNTEFPINISISNKSDNKYFLEIISPNNDYLYCYFYIEYTAVRRNFTTA